MNDPPQKPKSKLRSERERRGWSRKYVAERIAVSEYTIGQWERGKHAPYPEHIQKLCELFETNAEALGLTGVPPGTSLDAEKDQVRATNSSPRTKRLPLVFAIVGAAIVLALALGVIVYVRLSRPPAHVKPGGAWISPVGSTVGDV